MTSPRPAQRPYDVVKRAIDLVVAFIGLLLTAPVQAVLAYLVARNLGRPVLFRQRRPGLYGKPFMIVKFRTMREADPEADLITDADRLTPFGSALRSTSLDELPTLWNVLRGDMSMIGPRPLLMEYLPRYTPAQAHRHDVRPGITGLAQVSGRNAMSWEERLRADVDYVERRSVFLDLTVLARTVLSVARRDGITAEGEVTMPKFTGGIITDQPTRRGD